MSTLETNLVQPSTGTTLTLGASGDTITVPSGATLTVTGTLGGTGVSNVIQTIVSSSEAIGSTSLTDLASATLDITPTSTSSKILILGRIQADIGDNGFGYAILRDTTNIFETTAGYDVYNNTGNVRTVNTVCYLDSPSSTSQITYKYQVKTYDSDNVTFQNAGQSIITAMELK